MQRGVGGNPDFAPSLIPYDLSRGGHLYVFHRTATVTETAFYAQDSIHLGRLSLQPGLRYDR